VELFRCLPSFKFFHFLKLNFLLFYNTVSISPTITPTQLKALLLTPSLTTPPKLNPQTLNYTLNRIVRLLVILNHLSLVLYLLTIAFESTRTLPLVLARILAAEIHFRIGPSNS